MSDAFPISDPKQFFEEFVLRAYNEYLGAPLDSYYAKNAVFHADVMAERVWDFFKGSNPAKVAHAKNVAEYRRFLAAKECSDFQLIWDVNDSHKHVHLDRRHDRKISSAGQAGVRRKGAFGSGAFGAGAFGGTSEFVVVLDDGDERPLSPALANVIQMWKRILSI